MPSFSPKLPFILSIGEILFDSFPDGDRLGGAPFNFICHLHNMGFPTAFLSRIGDDEPGKKILNFLDKRKINRDLLQIDPQKPTGRVQVDMKSDGSHAFNILTEQAYDYISYPEEIIESPGFNPSLIYFGTLGQRGAKTGQTISQVLKKKRPNCLNFLDINLRAPFFSKEVIERSLNFCNILKINNEELSSLKGFFPVLPQGEEECLRKVANHFGIDSVCLTKGDKGSRLLYQNQIFTSKPVTVNKLVDTVGAGDGYAAILAMGILQNWTGEAIINRASEFAARLCESAGAVPGKDDFYSAFKDWTHNAGK